MFLTTFKSYITLSDVDPNKLYGIGDITDPKQYKIVAKFPWGMPGDDGEGYKKLEESLETDIDEYQQNRKLYENTIQILILFFLP